MRPRVDPRLANVALLRLAAMRLRYRRTHPPRPVVMPPPQWWDELVRLVQTEPDGAQVAAVLGLNLEGHGHGAQ